MDLVEAELRRDGEPGGPAEDPRAVLALDPEAGDEGLVMGRRTAVLERHAGDHVAARLGRIPRAVQRDEGVAAVFGGELRAVVEDQAERRRVRFEQQVGHDGRGDQIGPLRTQARLRIGAQIGVGPTVERAVLEACQIIGHQAVAHAVALVDRDVDVVGAGPERDADRVAQARRVGPLVRPVDVEDLDGGARFVLDADVAGRADGDVETALVAVEREIARPVTAAGAERAALGDRQRPADGARLARRVAVAPDAARVGDVEVVAGDRQPVRPLEAAREGHDQLGLAAAIGVAQQRDAARARLGEEDVAVGRHGHPARVIEPGGEDVGAEAGRHPERRAGRPVDAPRRVAGALRGIGRRQVLDAYLEALADDRRRGQRGAAQSKRK